MHGDSHRRHSQRHILIVDDQEANVSLLEQMLRDAGYTARRRRPWIRRRSARCIGRTAST